MNQAEQIKNHIVKYIGAHPTDILTMSAKHFNVTSTTVRRHLNWLLKQGIIIKTGKTRNVKYYLESSLIDVFKKYQGQENLSFNKTEIIVELSRLNEETLISRSQAKRITRGLDKFSHIILDFSGIRLIGQGFVDEIFRVFSNSHPDIIIEYIHANDDIQFMIKRSLPG